MAVTFRRMRSDDIEAALLVRLSTVENTITMRELRTNYGVTPSSISIAMKTHARGWLCEDNGKVVGFAMGDRSNGEVSVIAVLPAYEGRGIGRTLLSLVQDWLFSGGYTEIWLLANPDPDVRATGFYRKLGWIETGIMKESDQVLKLRKIPAGR